MFGVIADLLASIITILFPVFASYKALKDSDPAQLTPWLIYFVILSLILLVESWTVFILGWLPFYSWIRLFFLSYLVLPQTQGAKLLYFNHVAPFIAAHETDIEVFISNAHERAAELGLSYVKKLIDLIRDKVLGQPPPPPPATTPQSYGSAAAAYSASLLSRFSIPSARVSAVSASSSDIYSLLSSAVSAASGKSSTTKADPLAMPTDASTPNEKLSYIASQREKLPYLLTMLDRESNFIATSENASHSDLNATTIEPVLAPEGSSGLAKKRNKSEHSFENIDRDEVSQGDDAAAVMGSKATGNNSQGSQRAGTRRTTSSGSWLPTSWFASNSPASATTSSEPEVTDTKTTTESEEPRSRTSGFEAGN